MTKFIELKSALTGSRILFNVDKVTFEFTEEGPARVVMFGADHAIVVVETEDDIKLKLSEVAEVV